MSMNMNMNMNMNMHMHMHMHMHMCMCMHMRMYMCQSERPATFRALRSRDEFKETIPIFRTWYGKPARIFLVQGSGELMMSLAVKRSEVREEEEEYLDADGGDDAITTDDNELEAMCKVLRAIRSAKGTQQGCVLGTIGAIVPYHQVLRDVCKKYEIEAVCQADEGDDS